MTGAPLEAALRRAQAAYAEGFRAAEALAPVLDAARALTGARAAMVVAVDAEGNLRTLVESPPGCEARPALETLAWRAAAYEKPVRGRLDDGTRVALPARARGRVVGVLALDAEPGGPDPGALEAAVSPALPPLALILASESADRRDIELTRLFDFSVDMLCTASADGYFHRINPAFTRVLGYSAEELRSRPILAFVHPDDREATAAQFARLEQGTPVLDFENRYRHRDGHWLWLGWRAIPHADGFLYAVARNITERRQAEARQQRLVAIIEETTDLVWITDATGRLAFLNRVGRERLGLPEGEVAGRPVTDLLHAGVDPASTGEALAAAERDGSWRGETVLAGAGGEPIEVSQVTQVHGRGDERYFSTVARDISAQKQVERLKDEFVSVVSHELRTPLTSIRGSLGLLEGGAAGDLPAAARKMVQIARGNTDRLIRLINDILDLEKLEAGHLELDLDRVDPRSLVERTFAALEGVARQAGVGLESAVEVRGGLTADADRLIQVLTNLVGNAVKYSPGGGQVLVRVQGAGDRVRFSVQDHGPGIPPEHLDRVFDRFEQVDASDSRAKGGTGLGLAISKALVEQHHGRIWVESTLGAGSTFHFELPAELLPPEPVLDEGERHRVLLVEDDDDLARIIGVRLEHCGYAVRRAPGVESAWRALAEEVPAVVLLDLHLEDGWGLDLLTRMRAEARTRDVPVIVVSGRQPRRGRSEQASLLDWITKPFEDGHLVGAVWRAVRTEGPATALVVEDDADGAAVVVSLLERAGLRCLTADDGAAALRLVEEAAPDLIVLDVDLPHLDGFGLVEALRRQKARATPLLVYTGRDLAREERSALRLGVTRYLVKARSSEADFLEAVADLLGGLLPHRPRERPA